MIRVEALGGLRILVNGEESVPLAKQRLKSALLVYLAVERSCMREALIGTFWPEREPERARHVLSQTVYELRKQLGEEWLTIAGDRLTVSDRVSTDVVEFTEAVEKGSLENALRLYHGGFLDGTYLAESHEFEEWCDRRNQRLTKLLRRALKETCELPEVPSWIEQAIDVARKSAERDPTDDEIQHALLQLLVRAGRRTDALRQYEKYEAALAADDLEPLEHTRALIATIREATESVEPVAVTPFAHGNGPAVVTAPPRPTPSVPVGTPARDRAARKRSGAIVGGAMIIALAVVLPFVIGDPSNNNNLVKAAEGTASRIAVMPFEDLSPPGENVGYFAAGLTEGMIEALGGVRGIEVRSLSATRYYSKLALSPDSLGRALDVDFVVNGSVTRSGNTLKGRFEVTNSAGRRVAGIEASHNWGDFLQMRDTLVSDIAVALRQAIGQNVEMREYRNETDNAEALDHFQRAQQIHEDFVSYMLANGIDAADRALKRADSIAQIAVRSDPKWAAPLVLRGKLAAQRVQVILYRGPSPSRAEIREALNTAIQHATRAISVDPAAPEGHELRGLMRYRLRQMRVFSDTIQFRKNDAAAEEDLNQAIALDSTRAESWSALSELFLAESRFLESRTAARRAYESDRYYVGANDNLYRLAISSFESHDDAGALRWCAEGRRRFPLHPQFVYCHLMLLAWGDTVPAAVDSAWKLVALAPKLLAAAPGEDTDALFRMMTASVIARAGNADSARKVMDRIPRATASAPAMIWVEAAARARAGDLARADSLMDDYLDRIGLPLPFLLNTRALKPIKTRERSEITRS